MVDIQLTLDNLDEIHHMLTMSFDKATGMLGNIDFHTDIAPSSENRQWTNEILDQTSGYLLEVSHVASFLQKCERLKLPLLPHQQKLFIDCQELCKRIKDSANQVIKWVIQTKKDLNEEKCPIIDEVHLDTDFRQSSDEMVMSEDLLQTYQQVRDILKDIHKEVMFLDPQNMIHTTGRRLEVMQGKHLFIETEHEMNVLCDYGLFQYRKNGKNVAEQYYDLHHQLYPAQKLAVLQAFKQARFSLLEIIKPMDEHGLIVYDHLVGESFLMIDKGLYQLARTHSGYALLTHYLQMPNFILTTGASTPVLLDSVVGKNMWQIFKRLIDHHQYEKKLETSVYLQCITDLFKTAIHENVAKTVASRELPMSYRY